MLIAYYIPFASTCLAIQQILWNHWMCRHQLHVIDLAGNNFTGNLPHEKFLTWKAMMANALLKLNHLQFESEQYRQLYYQNAITVTGKGREMQLVKIVTSIDFSCNNFHGSIPKEIGKLQVLYTQLVT